MDSMTKTQARAWIRLMRQDLRDAEVGLATGNRRLVIDAMRDISGCSAEVETAAAEGNLAGVS